MHRVQISRRRLFGLASGLAVAVGGLGTVELAEASGGPAWPRAVYTLTNGAAGNAVLIFSAGANQQVVQQSVSTGGTGTGAGLGSQGALISSPDGRWLFAVNAGSGSIASLAIRPHGLELIDTIGSGGQQPISLTLHGSLLYALNAGGAGSISGFKVDQHGRLQALANSTRPLSSGAAGPAQVSFGPRGRQLIVTEKATSRLSVYQVGHDGLASGPMTTPSHGMTPFGFAITRRGLVIVSEAFGGAPGASAASSYWLRSGGHLHLVTGSAPTQQTAACWVVATGNGRYAYTTNTGSSSISGYQVNADGRLKLLNASGVTATTGPGTRPIDASIDRGNRLLVTINGGAAGSLSAFTIGSGGSLTPLTTIGNLLPTVVGLTIV